MESDLHQQQQQPQ
ncbi:hypothetical protein A2U01_0092188, partial [Trifolium medium]|nr:hypothetical protein [Trifolium medium]